MRRVENQGDSRGECGLFALEYIRRVWVLRTLCQREGGAREVPQNVRKASVYDVV